LELKSRGQKLDFVTYESVATAYKEDFTMQVPGLGRIMIGEMNPRLIKSPLLEGRKKSISG
jgi:hypothetical protein